MSTTVLPEARVDLAHEFFHGRRWGKWPPNYFDETMCNAGQHTAFPGELQMFNGNFRYPWRNVNRMKYQSSRVNSANFSPMKKDPGPLSS